MEYSSALVITETLKKELSPESVLDLGAGPCVFSNLLADSGCEVVGVDAAFCASKFAHSAVRFIQADLTRPLDLGQKFDLVLCLELAEHLPEKAETVLCKTLVRHTGRRLVMTAAPPGQEGRHHINLKPQSFWIRKVSRLGLEHEPKEVTKWRQIWTSLNVLYYYINNLMIFRRPD